jgi:vacuolar-type H+-ATPase subunit E/Vma4
MTLLLAVGAGPAHAQSSGGSTTVPRGLDRLWSAYPVKSKPRQGRTNVHEVSTRAAREESSSTSSGFSRLAFVLVGLIGAMAALAAFLVLRPRAALDWSRPRLFPDRSYPLPEGLKMNDFLPRLFNASKKNAQEGSQNRRSGGSRAAANLERLGPYLPQAEAADKASSQPGKSSPQGHTRNLGEDPIAPERRPDEPQPADPASVEVGDQVATILSSAKQAAQELRESARQEAERIREQATTEAAATLVEAEKSMRLKSQQGDKLRAEAEAYSKSIREAADRETAEAHRKLSEETAKRNAEAEREAREIRRAAKQMAEELTNQAHERNRALSAQAEQAHARLQQLLGVFRAMTSQLEELLPEERVGQSSGQARDDPPAEQLAAALKPQASPSASSAPRATP